MKFPPPYYIATMTTKEKFDFAKWLAEWKESQYWEWFNDRRNSGDPSFNPDKSPQYIGSDGYFMIIKMGK